MSTPPTQEPDAPDRRARQTAAIAHDFSNVLMVVLGHLDAAILERSLPEDLRSSLGRARAAAERGVRLVEHLLMVDQQEVVGRPAPPTDDADLPGASPLDEVVAAELPMLQEVLGDDIELTADLAPTTGVVAVTGREISQVLLNLAVNARQAMPEGGTVRVRTTRLHGPLGPGAAIIVEDTGAGMTDETRRRAFEPFYSTKATSGSGLGLATAAQIVAEVGGTIGVDSEVGAGATFTVWFPLAHVTADGGAPAQVSLVVDDDPEVRRFVAMTLRSLGHLVHESMDGAHALAAAEHFGSSLSLLVTDINMPGLAGVELADKVLRPCPSVRTLLMTGYADQGTSTRSRLDSVLPSPVLYMGGYVDLTPLRGPARALLRKPFTREELTAAVHEVTGRKRRRTGRRGR